MGVADLRVPRDAIEVSSATASAQLVKRGDLEVERFVGGAPTPVRGDGHAMDLTADATDFDWPRVCGRIGVDLEAPELAGGLATERNHPAKVNWFGASFRAMGLGHQLILSGCEPDRRHIMDAARLLLIRLRARASFSRVEVPGRRRTASWTLSAALLGCRDRSTAAIDAQRERVGDDQDARGTCQGDPEFGARGALARSVAGAWFR